MGVCAGCCGWGYGLRVSPEAAAVAPLSDFGSFGHISVMRPTASLWMVTLALVGSSGCKQQADRCSGFPNPGGRFSVLMLYPPQFSGEPQRRMTYSDAQLDDPKVRKAKEEIALCYPRRVHEDFRESLENMRFVGARLSPSGQYYLVYDFLNMTDVVVVFELNQQGRIMRSMVGSMVDG